VPTTPHGGGGGSYSIGNPIDNGAITTGDGSETITLKIIKNFLNSKLNYL
jgi:hypothetical protein